MIYTGQSRGDNTWFPNRKIFFEFERSNRETISVMNGNFEELHISLYKVYITKLDCRYEKYISISEDYVD